MEASNSLYFPRKFNWPTVWWAHEANWHLHMHHFWMKSKFSSVDKSLRQKIRDWILSNNRSQHKQYFTQELPLPKNCHILAVPVRILMPKTTTTTCWISTSFHPFSFLYSLTSFHIPFPCVQRLEDISSSDSVLCRLLRCLRPQTW